MNRFNYLKDILQSTDHLAPCANAPLSKHLKMAQNPFRFFRGSANLFYEDIAEQVLEIPYQLDYSVPITNVMGDCHISNFGFLTEEGAHGDNVIFSPNDFDDACIGHCSWDITRFLVSMVLATRYCDGVIKGDYQSEEVEELDGLAAPNNRELLSALSDFIETYLQQCQRLMEDPKARYQVMAKFSKSHMLRELEKKAKKRASGGKNFFLKSALAKSVELSAIPTRFSDKAGKFKRLSHSEYQAVSDAFSPYMDDAILDIVQRLGAGTGSENMTRYYILVGPKQYQGREDMALCQIVEVKQQREAAPLKRFKSLSPINQLNPAHLTVNCQRRMQRNPDLVLDEVEWRNQHWLVRSRHHARLGIDPEDIALSSDDPGMKLSQYAKTCASALALAHARGDRRSTAFEKAVLNTLPNFAQQIIDVSWAYADVVETDTKLLRQMLGINEH